MIKPNSLTIQKYFSHIAHACDLDAVLTLYIRYDAHIQVGQLTYGFSVSQISHATEVKYHHKHCTITQF